MMADSVNGRWPLVVIFGGSGFVGRHIVRSLARQDWRIRVACRRPDLAGHLQPLGRVGQIQVVQANLRQPASVAACLSGANAVVNLVGILRSQGRQTFEAIHAAGAATVARAASDAGVSRLIHMSALGADPSSPSLYGRTKAAGEKAAQAASPGAIIMRPSVIFGPEDSFLNRFAAMARLSPALPLIGGGATLLQPICVTDVAEAFILALNGEVRPAIYELGGPQRFSLREIMEFVNRMAHRRRLLLPLPWPMARALAMVNEPFAKLGLLPDWAVLTRDQVELLRVDNIVSISAEAERRTLQGLSIVPDSMEAVAPTYLWRFRKAGQYERDRRAA